MTHWRRNIARRAIELEAGSASPEIAWRNGVAAAGQGAHDDALLWLERAVRLAPNDPRIALDLANIRLRVGGAEQIAKAAAEFEQLTARYDAAAGWLGLLAARRLAGDHAGAADALQQLLSRHCVPDGAALPGSPVDVAALRRVEGLVEVEAGALIGWVSRPAAPEDVPPLTLVDAKGREKEIIPGGVLPATDDAPLLLRHGFGCSLEGLEPPFRVIGADGDDILGSPIDPRAEMATAPIPSGFIGPANAVLPERRQLLVVVPVYRGLAATQACLQALLAALPAGANVILVDDATPEPALADWLDTLGDDGRVKVVRHRRNYGFPAAANAGLREADGRDVLLLNSDTLVPPGAIEALADALYARADTGSATPFSNEATILNYPRREGANAVPDLAGASALNALAASANRNATVEIPTAVGFCMAMRHDCIAATGLFRPDLFAQGYGEENDWCLRARHQGFRHVAGAGAYVAHQGGVSFGAAGRALAARNLRLLNRLHPGYDALIAAHVEADPLGPARRRLDAARFQAGRRQAAVLLISHHHGGGVERRVREEMRQIRAAGQRPILLFPATPDDPRAQLTDGEADDYPNLKFTLPAEEPALLRLLRAERITHVVLHHRLGHHATVRGIAEKLGCQQDIVIHDYASFCPRVHLLGPENRYCGEPNLAACTACVAAAGDETLEELGPKKLLARSRREFAQARRVIAPSADASRRIARHFPGVAPEVTPWEDDSAPVTLKPPGTGARRVAIIGGIGVAKGYDILLACALDAGARGLPLRFLIAGSSSGDEQLFNTGRVFVTGPYQENEAAKLITGLRADLAFLPSIWPETWCFTLSEAWRAGLYALAFDLGAPAERITATGRGAVLPLGLPAPRINEFLLAWNPGVAT